MNIQKINEFEKYEGYSYEVSFKRTFINGNLKYISMNDTLIFPTLSSAIKWVDDTVKNKTLNYKISEINIKTIED
jgi:hypothetical protein